MPLKRHFPILIALGVSVVIIGASFWFVNKDSVEEDTLLHPSDSTAVDSIPSIRKGDHVLGNPNAPLLFIVYSDFGCPHCKEYHRTMHRIVDMYGMDGDVAWVFRHVPMVQLHPEAPMYALASECVAAELGDNGFWKFADLLFGEVAPAEPVSATKLVVLAEEAGANKTTFVECMRSSDLMKNVERDFEEAMTAGIEGSPYTVIITPSSKRIELFGAQTFKILAGAVQTAIRVIGATEITPPTTHETPSFADEFDAFATSTAPATTTATTSDVM